MSTDRSDKSQRTQRRTERGNAANDQGSRTNETPPRLTPQDLTPGQGAFPPGQGAPTEPPPAKKTDKDFAVDDE